MTQTSKHTVSPWTYFKDHIWHDDDCLAHVIEPQGQGTAEGNAGTISLPRRCTTRWSTSPKCCPA